MTMKTPRQECAEIISQHPGATAAYVASIIATYRKAPTTGSVGNVLREMVARGELDRGGSKALYTYYAGANIQKAIDNARIPGAPEPKKHGGSRYRLGMLQVKQTWLRAGEYPVCEPGDVAGHISLWSYADSFVTDATQVVEA
jgi:hypothetical protein